MIENIRGEFKSIDGRDYVIYVEQDNAGTSRLVPLSGTDPILISYPAHPDMIYTPLRTSTATVKFLVDDLPMDIYNATATSTRLFVIDKTDYPTTRQTKVVWSGYLQPCVYSQGYSNPIEELELVASDFLTHLQYFKYETMDTETIQLVSFENLLDTIFDKAYHLEGGYAWMKTNKIMNEGGRTQEALPSSLWISEANFFSTEGEPWTYQEVLEEMCKFMGWTALQWGDTVYFIDPQADYKTFDGQSIFARRKKNKNTGEWETTIYDSTMPHFDLTLNQEMVKLTGTDISLSEVWNKVSVKDNLYNVENILPDLNAKNEKVITNLCGKNRYVKQKAITHQTAHGPNEVGTAYYRMYDHKWWKQHYYDDQLNEIQIDKNNAKSAIKLVNYIGGSLCDYSFSPKQYVNPDSSIDPSTIKGEGQDTFKRYVVLQSRKTPKATVHFNPATSKNEGTAREADYRPLMDTTHVNPVIYNGDARMVISFNVAKQPWQRRPWIDKTGNGLRKQIDNKNQLELFYSNKEALKIIDLQYNMKMTFKLRVNGMWWNGKEWQVNETFFYVNMQALTKNSYFGTDVRPIDTTVYSEENPFIKDAGYQIILPKPIPNVRRSGNSNSNSNSNGNRPRPQEIVDNIYFAICQPRPSVYWDPTNPNPEKGDPTFGPAWNGQHWLTDLKLSICKAGETLWADTDVVYENELNQNHVIDGPEIDLRMTSANEVSFSYSTVGYKSNNDKKIHPVQTINREYLGSGYQKPEENIIEALLKAYQTPSIIQTMTLDRQMTPFDMIYDPLTNKDYFVIGTDIDLAMERQTLTLFEKKYVRPISE